MANYDINSLLNLKFFKLKRINKFKTNKLKINREMDKEKAKLCVLRYNKENSKYNQQIRRIENLEKKAEKQLQKQIAKLDRLQKQKTNFKNLITSNNIKLEEIQKKCREVQSCKTRKQVKFMDTSNNCSIENESQSPLVRNKSLMSAIEDMIDQLVKEQLIKLNFISVN